MDAPMIARIGAVLADPSRAAMLDILFDGDAHAIGQLGRRVGITPATASSHLRKLEDAGLVTVATIGREKHVRLAGAEVAEVLERIAALAQLTAPPSRRAAIRLARTCYDHLAGVLGVVIASALVERGWLYQTSDTFEPASAFLDWLAARGYPVAGDARRPLSRACLDGTERVPHLAGRVGVALAELAIGERWVTHVRDSRALRLTERGRKALARELGCTLSDRRVRMP
jgi:DNA-binding transcriptional ArsR family regulator